MGNSVVARTIDGRAKDIDGFSVRRILPASAQRTVGPFVFFDHMGPAALPAGRGLDVRPHPHINLATVTYLFEGAIEHRDSTGAHQVIRPGAVNWMTAGRGIVHSERSPAADRAAGPKVHGIQLWIALPRADEEVAPAFHHHPADTMPIVARGGARVRVLIGECFGAASPVATFSPMFYASAQIPAGATLEVESDAPERAAYVASGAIRCGAETATVGRMLVFAQDARPCLEATDDARVLLLGGAPLDGPRHLWWNFVSSRPERIEQAKADWAAGHFPLVPGDEDERIPLPG